MESVEKYFTIKEIILSILVFILIGLCYHFYSKIDKKDKLNASINERKKGIIKKNGQKSQKKVKISEKIVKTEPPEEIDLEDLVIEDIDNEEDEHIEEPEESEEPDIEIDND